MLDLPNATVVWPTELMPIGENTYHKEEFSVWWKRCGRSLSHLNPILVEQWVHRHWAHSPYAFLDLQNLTWRSEHWRADRIIREAHVPGREPLDADADYRLFIEGDMPTGRPFLKMGTWDFPIVLLNTPGGVRLWEEECPEVRFLLIEGHLRRRCLHAMMERGLAAEKHEVFILTDGLGAMPPAP